MDAVTAGHAWALAQLLAWSYTTAAENSLDAATIQSLRDTCANELSALIP